MHKQRLGVLIISILGCISVFMPWMHISVIISMNGFYTGQGKVMFALFTIPLILSLIGKWKNDLQPWSRITTLIFSVLIIGFGGLLFTGLKNPSSSSGNAAISAFMGKNMTIGFGIYLTLFAAICLPILTLVLKNSKKAKAIVVENANRRYKEDPVIKEEPTTAIPKKAAAPKATSKNSQTKTTSATTNASDIIAAVKHQSVSKKEFEPSDHNKYMPKQE